MGRSCLSIARSRAVIFATALLTSACTTSSGQRWTPFQLSLYPPAQILPETTDVRGWKMNILYGKNDRVFRLDTFSVCHAKSMFGLQICGIRNLADNLAGIQLALLGNESEERVSGAQLSAVANVADEVAGLQLAGIHNSAERVVGVQIGGVVNQTDELVGLQIGVLNFNKGGPLPFFPGFNFGFARAPEESEKSED